MWLDTEGTQSVLRDRALSLGIPLDRILLPFASLDEIATAKSEIFEGVVKGGHAVINRDSPQFDLLERAAAAAGVPIWRRAVCRIPL